ncbi:MAG: membrane protein insertion efficiency factor YidD [Candidatus Muirbacterium halophilum]|nr:membrane protein insertion efficiency factor YidD [Candidatus Muirbacterium halophilum]MCK9475782.1 membrane protein insertion efficiency factor YidD [Candidatus Muirbacterium halophilum]
MRYLNLLIIKILILYKRYISVFLGQNCRFYPSCSQYALECFQKFKFFKAFFKSLFRLLRCNQLFRGGYDPVK